MHSLPVSEGYINVSFISRLTQSGRDLNEFSTKIKHRVLRSKKQQPKSHKNLDKAQSDNESEIDIDKSCDCNECGGTSYKIKLMKKKFRQFSPAMHSIIRNRKEKLRNKLKNAVYAIMWLQKLAISRRKKKTQLRKIVRLKTKILDIPEVVNEQEDHEIVYIDPIQPIQVQMIDFKHKQRQSIANYLQHKLIEHEIVQNQLILPKIKQSPQKSPIIQNFKLKTIKEELKTQAHLNLKKLVHKELKTSSISPYLKSPLTLRVISHPDLKSIQTSRAQANSISQDRHFLKRQIFHQRQRTTGNEPF